MQEKCFNHRTKEADAKCALCAKTFCKECLLLTGELETVICENCYSIYKSKFNKNIKRRKIYLVLALILLVPIVYLSATMTKLDTNILILWSILIFVSLLNFIRIKQMRTFLQCKKYK